MPQVVDITRSTAPKDTPSKNTPGKKPGGKQPTGKQKPDPGTPQPLIIGVSAAVVVSILFLVWFFGMRPSADSRLVPQYPPSTRNLEGATSTNAAPSGNSGSKVAPGLPGDGG